MLKTPVLVTSMNSCFECEIVPQGGFLYDLNCLVHDVLQHHDHTTVVVRSVLSRLADKPNTVNPM